MITPLKPMLAAATNGKDLNYPVLVSPKLDGIRALVVGGVVMSRSLKPIPNKSVQKLFGRKEFNGFDGELVVGLETDPRVFLNSSSALMSIEGSPDVIFRVFDDFSIPLDGFIHRYHSTINRIEKLSPSLKAYIKHVIHVKVLDEESLFHHEDKWTSNGYEGIMIRDPQGQYKFGRSTEKQGWLMKLKRFEDSEAKIVGWKELMTNTNEATVSELGGKVRSSKKEGMVPANKLGAIIVEDLKTGIEFDIGTGFDESQRVQIWKSRNELKHAIVKYKYQPVGVKEKPRFPVFLGFRDKIDM